MTRIPGDSPNEGRLAAETKVNLESRPDQPAFRPLTVGAQLRCAVCGNAVRVEAIGGGRITCCGETMRAV